MTTLVGKERVLMNKLKPFFEKDENINKILPIIDGTSKISLRMLDWFVTNYTKTNQIYYNIKINNMDMQVSIYNDYKSQLKAYSKKRFDPFCRTKGIIFYYNETDNIKTTVCQLNFFKWIIENKILEQVAERFGDIEKDMNRVQSKRKSKNTVLNKDQSKSKC